MRLGSICKMKNGGTPSTKNPSYYLGSIPWISTVSLGPNYIDSTAAKAFISEEAVSNSAAKIIPPGSLLVGTRVGVGKSSITTVPLATNQDIVSLIDIDSRLNPLFLKFFLDSKASYFESRKKGATILGITTDDLKLLDVPEKTLQEQGAICNVMCYIQRSIQAQRNSILRLNEQVGSLFNDIFQQNKYPVVCVSDVCALKSGTTFPPDQEVSKGEILYCKVADMNLPGNEKYMTVSRSYVSRATAGKTIIPAGSVLFPKRGGAIGTNKKRIAQKDMCIDLNTMAVIPSEKIRTECLYQFFQGIDLGSICDGSTVPQLNNKDIGPLKMELAPIHIQEEFVEKCKQIDKLRFNYQRQIEVLQELMDKKMEEYFAL